MLPEINLTLKEAQALLMLIKEADNYINLPFKKSALLASLKIERSLQTVIKKQCNFNLRNYSIRPHPQAKVKLLDDLISKLQTAIKRKKVVRLKISDLTKKAIDISIHPYHLFYSKHSWYVIGKTGSGNISTFRINKRMEVVITDKFFSEGDSFDLKEHMGRAWSIRPEGLIYSVELWFAPEVAADVISVNWHETQYSEIQGDGSAIVEFRVDGLNEIVWWVLGYGHHVKVLSPRPLRRKVKEIAEKILKTK
jgi:proteasome accessory factor B